MAKSPEPSSAPASRRRRWPRRLLIGFLLLIILLAAAAITIQFVLWSTLPRDLIVKQLQQQLGVRVELADVQTGWWGRTRLTDLALSMPLADEPFLRAPSVRVSHTSLLMLILGRPLRINTAEVDQPILTIAQQPAGRWNIQALGASAGGTAGEPDASARRRGIDLPDLAITNATLKVVDQHDRSTTIERVQVSGRNETAFAYALHVVLDSYATIDGRLNLRDFDHRLVIQGNDLATPLKPIVPGLPEPLGVSGEWIGQVQGDGLRVLAHVRQMQVMQYQARGDVRLDAAEGVVELRPDGLVVEGGPVPRMQVIEGRLRLAGDELSAQGVRLHAAGGDVRVDGRWRLDTGTGSVEANWHDVELPATARHSGALTARLEPQLGGARQITASLSASGRAATASFDTALTLSGEGQQWERMDWALQTQRLNIEAGQYAINLDGLRAIALGQGDRLVLHDLTLQQEGRLRGEGTFVWVGNNAWTLELSGSQLPVSRFGKLVAGFTVRADGNRRRVNLHEMSFRAGELTATATGYFDADAAESLVLEVQASHPAPRDLVLADNPPLRGPLDMHATVAGTLDPLNLKLHGQLTGRDLRTHRRQIGDVSLRFDGSIDPHQMRFDTRELELLGGQWRFDGAIETAADGSRDARVNIGVRTLPIAAAAEVFRLEGFGGTISGDWAIVFPGLSAMSVEGSFIATDVVYGPARRQPATAPTVEPTFDDPAPVGEPIVHLDRITARTILRNRVIRVEDLQLRQAEGLARGRLIYRLVEPKVVRGDLSLSNWRLEMPRSEAALMLFGSIGLTVDFEEVALSGPIDLAADLILRQQKFGAIKLAGEFQQRSVKLPTIQASLFGGRIWGQLTLDLDRPLDSQGILQINDIDGAAIVATWPALEGLAGRYRGVIELRPADPEIRPLAPLRLSGFIDPADARFRAADIGSLTFDAFIDTRRGQHSTTRSRLRFVLDNTRLEAMGGHFDLRGRYTRHEEGEVSAQFNVMFVDLSLNQFWQTFAGPDDEAVPGVINGGATLLLDPIRPQASFGEADVRLTRSDLRTVGPIEFLYGLLNVGVDQHVPQGEGTLRLRLEGENLEITRMNYFNRGVEIWALGQFRNIWNMPQTEVEATVAGTTRPFRSLELPLLADVQDILVILQRDLTTVNVSGTVAKPDYAQAGFQQLSGGMLELLTGEMQTKAKRK